jgi:hypothetical protein
MVGKEIQQSTLGLGILEEVGAMLGSFRDDEGLLSRLHRVEQLTGISCELDVLSTD